VPGELQGQVGADEDVVAGRLDRGQDRLELEGADQFGDRVRRRLVLLVGCRVLLASKPGRSR
jgi:hypothetical protein